MNQQYLTQPPAQQQPGFGGFHNTQGAIPSLRPQNGPSLNGPPAHMGGYLPGTQAPVQIGSTYQPHCGPQNGQHNLLNSQSQGPPQQFRTEPQSDSSFLQHQLGPSLLQQKLGSPPPQQQSGAQQNSNSPIPERRFDHASSRQQFEPPTTQMQSGPQLNQHHTGSPQKSVSPLSQQQAGYTSPHIQSAASLPNPQPGAQSLLQQSTTPLPQQQSGPSFPQQQLGPSMPQPQSGPPLPQQQPGPPLPQQQPGPPLPQQQPGPPLPQQQTGPPLPQQQPRPPLPQQQPGPPLPQQQPGPPLPQQLQPEPPLSQQQQHGPPLLHQQQPGYMLRQQQHGPSLLQQQPGPPMPQQESGPPMPQQQSGPQLSGHPFPQRTAGPPLPNLQSGPLFSHQESDRLPQQQSALQFPQQQSRPQIPQLPTGPQLSYSSGTQHTEQRQFLPPTSQQPQAMPPPPHGPPSLGAGNLPPNLQSQLAGMTLNGSTRMPPLSQNNFVGGPMKPPPNGNLPSSFPPAVNGMHSPDQIPSGYMNVPQHNNYPPTHPQQDMYNQADYNNYPQTQPGYPPQPGYGTGGFPGYQQASKRLDPDHMPSPLEVICEDQKMKGGVFYTNQRGQVPPLVTTQFIVQDQGNCSPRYMRSSMYSVPVNTDIMKQAAVPFGLVISPLARPLEDEQPPPIVDMGDLGPVRCVRCKAYMCPFMQFNDGGRRFQCLFCKATTDVPEAYFQHLDHTGQRLDRYERPELVLGAYEFIATKEYCKNERFPKPPAMVFMIDVSYNNMKSGLVHLLCSQMKDILRNLPKEPGGLRSAMRVGFITYNNSVHFYNVKACLAQPQMMVVGDTNEMFMPLLDGFLVDPVESETVIDSLMEQIPHMFADTRETETILGPAIQAGMEALKAAECAGKLLIFHTSLPTAEAPGKLKNRDDRKLLGTDKEKTVLNPQNTFYNTLAQDCVAVGCSVDLYMLNNSYVDLATVGQICRLTGGEVFKYTYFQASIDGERLIADVKYNVGRPIVFDAVMRVRTSTGVRPTDFYGHFFMSNTTDMELASIDCDKAVALEVKHDDKLTEEEGVFVQVALLHTSCSGQRRIRVLNLSLKTCSQMADLYRSCELDTIMNFFGKQALYRLRENPPKQVKDSLINRCAMMLACYRKNCASPSSAGQLILPECMKLLPLYVSCLIKSDAISGGSDMTLDDRSFMMYTLNTMDIPSSVVYFYPRLISLHDLDTESTDIPLPIRCSSEKLREDGAYLLDNGIHMFLWFGFALSPEWVQAVFGVPSTAQINTDDTRLPELDNPISQRLRELVALIRLERHRFMRLTLIKQQDRLEVVMKHFLVEDRGMDGTASYVDFLCHMHKEIRSILS